MRPRHELQSKPPPSPPLTSSQILLSFPTSDILLVKLNNPERLNVIDLEGHWELDRVWQWFDAQSGLRVGIVTGATTAGGKEVFCAGMDLREWHARQQGSNPQPSHDSLPPSGFGGLSRRNGKKPIIAAVNGLALGGGCEMAINADLVIASASAIFALPEVKLGVVAMAGALPRLIRTVGRQRAMEMALTGRNVGADEACRWGLVNKVVDATAGGSSEEVVKMAVQMAMEIAGNSPDAVRVSREGLMMGWREGGVDEGDLKTMNDWYRKLEAGDNCKEGLRAFLEKRKPVWVDSKL